MKTQITIILFLLAHSAYSQHEKENNIFSFSTENEKIMTLTLDTVENVLIYRFGDIESPEVEVHDDLNDSIVIFKYSYYFRGGGIENFGLDLNYVSFNNNNYEYVIYYEYSAEGNSTSIGIKMLNTHSNEEYIISGLTETLSGSLIDFRFSDIIPIEED